MVVRGRRAATWTGKKIAIEEKIRASKAYLKSQQRVQGEAMDKSLQLKNANNIKTSMMAANMARKEIEREQVKLNRLQEELVVIVGKKPKKSE